MPAPTPFIVKTPLAARLLADIPLAVSALPSPLPARFDAEGLEI